MSSKFGSALLTHTKRWYLINAKGQRVGRLAAAVAGILQGKLKPTFHPSTMPGDNVVVINAKHVSFSGNKWTDKKYTWHTGYPGGFRQIAAKDLHEKKPTEVVRKAVSGMLPKTKLRPAMMRNLYLFEGPEHPFKKNIYAELEPPSDPQPPPLKMFAIEKVPEDGVIPIPDGEELVEEVVLFDPKKASASSSKPP